MDIFRFFFVQRKVLNDMKQQQPAAPAGSNNALPPLNNLVIPVSVDHIELPTVSGFDKDLKSAASSGTSFTKTRVNPDTPEFDHILSLATSANSPKYTSLERIVNPHLLRRFNNARKERIRRKSSDIVLLSGLSFNSYYFKL